MTKSVAIVIIDTYDDKALARLAVQRTLRCNIGIKSIYSISNTPIIDGEIFIKIHKITSLKEYSDLVINLLPYIVEEDYFFIVQWDGFITHPDRWEDIFFSYDYIGAPWIRNNLPIELDAKFSSVGNGGFSFRSRKLLEASKRIPVLIDECFPQGHAEDVALCLRYRQQLTDLGILFANEEVADRFSTELDTARPRLGFHGVPNLPLFLSDDEMIINITELLLRTHNNVSLCLLFIKLFETQRADVYQNLFDWCMRDKVKFTGLTSILECSKVKIPLFSSNIYF